MNQRPYDQQDDDGDVAQWEAQFKGGDLAFEPTSRLERWLAVKAFGLLLLFVLAALVLLAFWLFVQALVDPEPYQDPTYLGAIPVYHYWFS